MPNKIGQGFEVSAANMTLAFPEGRVGVDIE
jgi:hypothetical protein